MSKRGALNKQILKSSPRSPIENLSLLSDFSASLESMGSSEISPQAQISDDFCIERLIFTGQNGPTCWFNVLILCMFYSQYSRKLLLDASKDWDTSYEIYYLFDHLLKHKFVVSMDVNRDEKYFKYMTPQHILRKLHLYNKDQFPINKFSEGFWPMYYIQNLYRLLNISYHMFTLYGDGRFCFDIHNYLDKIEIDDEHIVTSRDVQLASKEYLKEVLKDTPQVLIVRCTNLHTFESEQKFSYYDISHMKIAKNILSKEDVITYNGHKYVLDSVITGNIDINDEIIDDHVIAGITCAGNRYVYNGWNIGKSLRPCKLSLFQWDVKTEHKFGLYKNRCGLNLTPTDGDVYSFDRGERLIIYVKKSLVKSSNSIYVQARPYYVSYMKNLPKNQLTFRETIQSPTSSASTNYSNWEDLPTPSDTMSSNPLSGDSLASSWPKTKGKRSRSATPATSPVRTPTTPTYQPVSPTQFMNEISSITPISPLPGTPPTPGQRSPTKSPDAKQRRVRGGLRGYKRILQKKSNGKRSKRI